MSKLNHEPGNFEHDRLQQASDLADESGPGGADEYRPGSFGCHELLDRTALVADLVDQHLLAHPACVANPAWYKLAEQVVNALHELYQKIGAEHLQAEVSSERTATGAQM